MPGSIVKRSRSLKVRILCFVKLGQFLHCLLDVTPIYEVVPPKDALGLVAADLHRDGFGHDCAIALVEFANIRLRGQLR
jgi:hypothetical protein